MEWTWNFGTFKIQSRVRVVLFVLMGGAVITSCRTGGEWLICDMYRGESLFELDPSCQVGSIQLFILVLLQWT